MTQPLTQQALSVQKRRRLLIFGCQMKFLPLAWFRRAMGQFLAFTRHRTECPSPRWASGHVLRQRHSSSLSGRLPVLRLFCHIRIEDKIEP
jgi:hypothetical protein